MNSKECTPEQGDPFLDLPEPQPEYDNEGKRTNTLEQRFRIKLDRDRNQLIFHCLQLNKNYQPPIGYRPPKFDYVM